ncbi:MAG TPA: zinc-binding alcohol dehydrogenase, partial [Amaricoccus sp.]|nr:zinc-binding alcohol dehydrogenase [Amaricoccus sp.]
MPDARALWITGPGTVALRGETVVRTSGAVLVETLWSGISRGTEALVLRGGVPASEHARMRAPLQTGDFPWPVKYGYAAVGRVLEGPAELAGKTVFVLHPHQDVFAAPAGMAIPVPEGVPPERAVLAANMETALNIAWDGGAAPGDRIAVVGGGTVGALVAWLCARLPGAEVTLVDIDPDRAALASSLGCAFSLPAAAPQDCDLVVHASA